MEDGNCLLQVKSILGGRYQTKPSAPRDPASKAPLGVKTSGHQDGEKVGWAAF